MQTWISPQRNETVGKSLAIRYKDIAPYYDQVDQLIGVCGGDDDQDSLPGSRYFLPPPPLRCGEQLMKRAARHVGIDMVPIRRAVLTRDYNGHTKCHYCGACGAGCDVGAFFNASDYLIEPALKTGKLNIVNNAVVARILVDDNGLADGVQYFDRYTKEEHRTYGKRVIVAASCVDSTRILLNSTSQRYPNGIGNSSDVIGRYLSDCGGTSVDGRGRSKHGIRNSVTRGRIHRYGDFRQPQRSDNSQLLRN